MIDHKGTQTIETPRLTLRRFVMEDAEAMLRNWAGDPEVTRFLTWPPHDSLDTSRAVLESWVAGYEQENCYQWAIVRKGLDEPIGSISGMHPDDRTGSIEIGYCIGRQWWHQGIMTEALGAVMEYLFGIGFERIEARHDPNNPHSGGVMRKCGMVCEGTSRRSDWNNQGICDIVHYAALKPRREAQPHFMADFTPGDDDALVQELYRRYDEDARLTGTKAGQVEFLTNVRCIEEYLKPGGKILDIGAGTGAYSLHFARMGYPVTALELADRNIEVFRSKLTPEDPVTLEQGNALDLSRYGDETFDIVLLFGPLYHLHSREDRLRCIREALRVCKPDGKVFFAFISNDMVVLTMFQTHPDYFLNGDYNKDTFRLDDFPFVFHTLPHCRELLQAGGVQILREVASDGVSELLRENINAMDDASFRQYLRYHWYICEKPEHLGMSNHLLFVGTRV